MSIRLERALFVVGPQNSGKSTQLRSMFRDVRFETNGVIPTTKKLTETYSFSNERRLYLRSTSPHEYGDDCKEFIEKVKEKAGDGRRWSFAGALQPNAFNNMPDVCRTVAKFSTSLRPERIRVVFLSPNRHGEHLADYAPGCDLFDKLHGINRVEVACIDARKREVNGLFLADFFDFN